MAGEQALLTGFALFYRCKLKGGHMGLLKWAVIFLIVALIAAFFGFGGVASAATGIAKALFFIFIVICVLLLILGLTIFKH